MPWGIVNEATFTEAEYGRYKFILLPTDVAALAWGISCDVAGAVTNPRLRLGFYAPFYNLSNRQYFGRSEPIFRGLDGAPLGIHLLSYEPLNAYSAVPGLVELAGVACSPDRGAFPATFTLWRLT